jgi:hypothetical protein
LQEALAALFASQGFVCESMLVHARTVENRKSGVKMPRRWIQAVFRYAPSEVPTGQIGNSKWETAGSSSSSPQQQQKSEAEQQQQKRQRVVPAAAAAAALVEEKAEDVFEEVQCAGRAWRVPAGVGSSSSSCVQQLALELDRLLQQQQQQQLVLLGRRALLLPPWLQLLPHGQQQAVNSAQQEEQDSPQQQQQQQQQQQGAHVALQDSGSATGYGVVMHSSSSFLVADSSSSSSSSSSSEQLQFAHGAAAGLLALVAVWLGAKRVYCCIPSSSNSSSLESLGAYDAGFTSVVQLNECTVVVERIRQRRWVDEVC